MSEPLQGWVSVKLPSLGAFYQGKLPGGEVQIRKLTVHEESVLQTPGMEMSERISTLIRNCCKLPDDFSYTLPGTNKIASGVEALLSSDKLALLLLQRDLTYGSSYTFPWRCPTCNSQNRSDVNLIRDLDPITPEVVEARMRSLNVLEGFTQEPFAVKLVDAGVTVQCRFLRGADDYDIMRRAKKHKSAVPGAVNPAYSMTLATHVVSVSGVDWLAMPDVVRENWIQKLTATDSAAIRREIERRETGIDTEIQLSCSDCGASSLVDMVLTAEFFRPTGY